MRSRAAVVELLKAEPEWRRFFKACCETGALRLRSQTWQFREELASRGHRLPRGSTELEDALFDLAGDLFPDSPAANWGAWAELVTKDALARLGEHYASLSGEERKALDLSATWERNDAIVAAGWEEDQAAFRMAVHGYEQATLEALKSAKKESGVA